MHSLVNDDEPFFHCSADPDGEVEFIRLHFDPVFFQCERSAAGVAETGHLIVDAEDGVITLFDVDSAHCLIQILGINMQSLENERGR